MIATAFGQLRFDVFSSLTTELLRKSKIAQLSDPAWSRVKKKATRFVMSLDYPHLYHNQRSLPFFLLLNERLIQDFNIR